MITYVLIISRNFPQSHRKAGQPTFFFEKIANTMIPWKCPSTKIHTIRKNYNLWESRIEKVKEGNAQISLRYWSGKPYRSKQITFCNLTKENNVGIQQIFLEYELGFGFSASSCEELLHSLEDIELLAQNDGLSVEDFSAWFFPKGAKSKSFSGAIIHFTGFRYP